MYNVWEIKYGLHHIRIEDTLISGKLFVDGILQDEQVGFSFSSRLFGKVHNEEGQIEDIKVAVGCDCLQKNCRVFIGDRLVYSNDLQWGL